MPRGASGPATTRRRKRATSRRSRLIRRVEVEVDIVGRPSRATNVPPEAPGDAEGPQRFPGDVRVSDTGSRAATGAGPQVRGADTTGLRSEVPEAVDLVQAVDRAGDRDRNLRPG